MSHSFFDFLSEQWKPLPPAEHEDMSGKTIVITGANSGLGYEAARHFCRMNPGRLILACRNRALGDAAVAQLEAETRCMVIELVLVDLADFMSVRSMCDRLSVDGTRLDILILNAGVIVGGKPRYTKDGWSEDLQVNNLSSSLISILLLPTMLKTAEVYNTTPRIVVVGSAIHFRAKFEPEIIGSEHPLRAYNSHEHHQRIPPATRYYDCKLLNIFFVRALNKRFVAGNLPIIVNCVNPGYCASRLRRPDSMLGKAMAWLGDRLLARTAEEGSRQIIWGAIGGLKNEETLRGAYISLSAVCEPSSYVTSDEGVRVETKIWEDLVRELSAVEPGVSDIVARYLK